MFPNFEEILTELSYRVDEGVVDLRKPAHMSELILVLNEHGISNATELAESAGLVFGQLVEIEFKNKADFIAYNNEHEMRPATRVKIANKTTTVGNETATSKQDTPKPEKPSRPVVDTDELTKLYAQKSEITKGIVSTEHTELPNGTKVRQLLDTNGNAVDVSTDSGRKAAVAILTERLDGVSEKTLKAIDNFNNTTETVKKWLGEVGELQALKQLLELNTEAYLLTDSERKNDIAVVDRSGDSDNLNIGFISVKSTQGESGVNALGANCKADYSKLTSKGDDTFSTTISGAEVELNPSQVIGSTIDIKSGIFKKFSINANIKKVKLSDGKLAKLPEYDRERNGDVPSDKLEVVNGKTYFRKQSGYLQHTRFTKKDADEFFNDEATDRFLTNLDPKNNSIKDTSDRKKIKAYIKDRIVTDIVEMELAGKVYSLADLNKSVYAIIGETFELAHVPIGATGDTMAISFKKGSTTPNVSVIRKEDADESIQDCQNSNKNIKDNRERRMGMVVNCLKMSSRTRALPSTGGRFILDGIDNLNGRMSDIKKAISLPHYLKAKTAI